MIDPYEAERTKLRALQSIFEKAVANNTIEDMRKHVGENFSFVSFTDTLFTDFDAFSKQWKLTRDKLVGNGSFSTELNPFPTLFINDLAICSGNATNNMVDKKGGEFSFTTNWTVILQQTGQEWKVLRAHNSLSPFTNPMMKAAVKRLLINIGALAFFVGASAMWLVQHLY